MATRGPCAPAARVGTSLPSASSRARGRNELAPGDQDEGRCGPAARSPPLPTPPAADGEDRGGEEGPPEGDGEDRRLGEQGLPFLYFRRRET